MTQITKKAAAFAGSFFVVKFILAMWDVLCFCRICSVSFFRIKFQNKNIIVLVSAEAEPG